MVRSVSRIGGDKQAAIDCQGVFRTFANSVVHLGDVGSGQFAKLLNNALLAANLAIADDTLALGETLGLDADRLVEFLSCASGRSYALGVAQAARASAETRKAAATPLRKDMDGLQRSLDPGTVHGTLLREAAGQAILRLESSRLMPPSKPFTSSSQTLAAGAANDRQAGLQRPWHVLILNRNTSESATLTASRRQDILGEPMRAIEAVFSPEPRASSPWMTAGSKPSDRNRPTLASRLEERPTGDPRAGDAVVHAQSSMVGEILIVRDNNGVLHTLDGSCLAEKDFPLVYSDLDGFVLMSANHFWRFDVTAGRGTNPTT